jgi:hypothetical protein
LLIRLTFSGHSTDAQCFEIKNELHELFSNYNAKPSTISCHEGSTIVLLQYVLENLSAGFLGAIGGSVFVFISEIISRKTDHSNIETQPKEQQVTPIESKNQHVESFIKHNIANDIPIEDKPMNLPQQFTICLEDSSKIEIQMSVKRESPTKTEEESYVYKYDNENNTHEEYTYRKTKYK